VFYVKPYTIRDGHGLYCSDACRGISQRSEMQDRSGWQYKAWRTAVFTRDNWTCQSCSRRGGDLHAHHIELWSRRPELRFEVSNGLTLHEECHRALHIEQKTGFFS
jgi:5-methylcytosine-specific restriction endonuclease McrA